MVIAAVVNTSSEISCLFSLPVLPWEPLIHFRHFHRFFVNGCVSICNTVASVPLLASTWPRTRDPLNASTTVTHEALLPAIKATSPEQGKKQLLGFRAGDITDWTHESALHSGIVKCVCMRCCMHFHNTVQHIHGSLIYISDCVPVWSRAIIIIVIKRLTRFSCAERQAYILSQSNIRMAAQGSADGRADRKIQSHRLLCKSIK